MTSNNVTYFRIEDLSGKVVGEHRQHCYCKTHWDDLLVFTPPENYQIIQHGFIGDDDEETYENEPINLAAFLNSLNSKRKV